MSLVLFESGLRIAKYGEDYSVFKPLSSNFPDLIVFNPYYPKKIFQNTDVIPSVIPDPFYKEKRDNSFRVFVLGGSTTAGFPFSYNASFARRVKRRLEILFPKIDAEVINMGISAVNSYTIKDILPDIIKQKPDLVLIYAGHNEYYGALGVGSTELIGNNELFIGLNLKLREFKVYQLISNFFESIKTTLKEMKRNSKKTLMEQMVSEKLIEFDSDIYERGLEQFNNNMNSILSSLKQAGINTIISTVSSNLKQKPFESVGAEEHSADKYFNDAENYFNKSDYELAKINYKLSKENDALRFRAPEKINSVIKDLAYQYHIPVANTDSLFSKKSVGEITGYNLMVDHLHPTVYGHQLIGDLFFDKMLDYSYIPESQKRNYSYEKQVKFANSSLAYTKFDSMYAEIILSNLLNSYPFAKHNEGERKKYLLKNFSDSLAKKVVKGEMSWEKGHFEVAEEYFNNGEYEKYIAEMNALIQDRSFIKSNYILAVDKLKSKGQLDKALQILLRMNRKFNDNYSKKLLGNIAVNKKKYKLAIFYYEKFLEANKTDPDVYYNISGVYFQFKMLDKAKSALEKCIEISPNYPRAKNEIILM
ncbi:MAG: GDSL-type esterase/lipase family protein, partial [Melioribacteraceae bacterium]|nr:GDSL-type esterase/lipase family protein [Melioribacteraceae bacterium]